MKHRIVTAAQMKEIERAGNAHGLPYLQMMENAVSAVVALAADDEQLPAQRKARPQLGVGGQPGVFHHLSRKRFSILLLC